ncbi:peptidase M48 [Hahella sp. CCB-MM4]|uniref:M48 family metallopeptidase n=1 Tax=Hahella sp. (strain CCB-MM4) TaxID=1926491 RepID=UPI000B9C5C4E|nr:M48 family metallopeptidase [Hahella sp. CCB-MM4]OZG71556.1 peptidase M48 [Hahella sp. CCB-MM4]
MEQAQTYEAHAFHEQFNKGRSSGSLKITATAIEFDAGDGPQGRVRFPINRIQVKMGGASNRLVFITHPDYPDWNLYTSDRSVLKNPDLHLDPSLQGQLRSARNVRRFSWAVLFLVAFLIVAAPVSVFVFMDSITAVVARQVPVEWEEKIGKTAFGQYQVESNLLDSEEGEKAIAALTDPLINAVQDDRFTYKIYVSDSPDLNAFALPGGYIVINAGLILAADNGEEVLGVMAHEISHVTEQHGVRNIIAATGTYTLIQAMFGDVSGLLATVVNAAPFLLNQSYSRDFEADADEKGLQLLQRAEINPTGMISFFEKIIEEEKKRMEQIEDDDTRELLEQSMGFLSSHPATEERIASLRKQLGTGEGDYRHLDTEFLKLQELVRNFVADTGSDEELPEN